MRRVAHDGQQRRTGRQWSRLLGALLALSLFAGCASRNPPPSNQHLEPAPPTQGQAPDFALVPPAPKPPKPMAKPELYSVVVHNMEVQDLLFAMARDAKMNVDIHPNISGTVTMNAVDQTLTEILDRIAKQVDMRYELSGKNLSVMPDTPFLRLYRIDYPNVARNSQSSVGTSVTVASAGGDSSSSGGSGSNSSGTSITNTSNNRFWETLIANVRDILRETDKVLPEGSSETTVEQSRTPTTAAASPATTTSGTTTSGTSSTSTTTTATTGAASTNTPQQSSAVIRKSTFREAASVIANPENGVINVRATQRQHDKIREFLDSVMGNARRQVLIEASIVEVDLSDRYQQGIDWSLLRTAGSSNGTGINMRPAGPNTGQITSGVVSSVISLAWNKTSWEYAFTSALRLLESFGTLRVLSSPKLSIMNNQTSLLKVVDNEVYFLIEVTPGTAATATSPATPAIYTTKINTVPIGFLMTVTPQISENGEVILNLRPTISRISAYRTDPNPALAQNNLTNRVPVVQTREMESVMRIQNGDIAVLGGLMQDTRDRKIDAVPGVSNVPVLGELLKYQDNTARKTELVVFLRPTVLTDASIDGDFRGMREMLNQARDAYTPPSEAAKPIRSRP